MKKIKQYIMAFSLLIFTILGFTPMVPTYVAAAPTPTQAACGALGSSDCRDTSGGPSVSSIVKAVINLLSLVVGVVAVIMIIVGGLRYVTSNGDSNSITGAKNTIIYAVIGLIVALLAQVLVQFVLNKIH